MRTIFILSISSDIGLHVAKRYLDEGFCVIGTFRRSSKELSSLRSNKNCILIQCDVSKKADIVKLGKRFKSLKVNWDTFISCVGDPLPVTSFFESKFEQWEASVHVNCVAQLHALHVLYPYRNTKGASVGFFAAGGSNGAVVNFSAYTASKIFLTKMCEFLDAENQDLNIFIVGPGWTKTKIHQTIINDKQTYANKIKETKNFLKAKSGTSLDDIFECIDWLSQQEKSVVSGRNFSVVYDPWQPSQRQQLLSALKKDSNMYKLRRSGNDFLQRKG